MTQYKVGTQRGYSYGDYFDQADYLKKSEVDTVLQLEAMLSLKRIDLSMMYYGEFIAHKKQGRLKEMHFIKPTVGSSANYIGFSKPRHLEKLANQFAQAMLFFKRTPKYQKLLKKYDIAH